MSNPEREKKLILVVDDDPDISDSVRAALIAEGYDVLVARDGNSGIVMAERESPDLMILDMMMPKRSGFLVVEALRQTSSFTMRVIMITANEGSRHEAYAKNLGIDAYIRKPFPMDRLLMTVEKVFKDEPIEAEE